MTINDNTKGKVQHKGEGIAVLLVVLISDFNIELKIKMQERYSDQ